MFLIKRVIVVLLLLSVYSVTAQTVRLADLTGEPIGEHLSYFQEQTSQLSLQQAQQVFNAKQVNHGQGEALSIGIGVDPVWLQTQIINDSNITETYRISIDTPWLDYIDLYLVAENGKVTHVIGGDHLPYDQQPMPYKNFAYETTFPAGVTNLYFRVQTESVMPIPVRVTPVKQALNDDIINGYQYGLLYGVLLSLALYNGLLYFMIRQREFGLYSAYLIGFVVNSLSYTGVLHTFITGDHGMLFQDYVNEFLMITYSVLGLLFAVTVLNTRQYAPRLYKTTIYIAYGFPIAMFIAALFNQILITTILAFVLNIGFVSLFIVLAVYGVIQKVQAAKLFLVASVTAATCVGISTAAVASLLPYNSFTFKAIEIGMAFEAIMLAILLAQRFRTAQVEKQVAEYYARTDELTSLNNRRGFTEKSAPIWNELVLEKRDVSVLLLDLDRFKQINDTHGHATGDLVLINAAKVIQKTVRSQDIVARWGGEEFILFLPDTPQSEAITLAEQIREGMTGIEINYFDEAVEVSTSVGVCGTKAGQIFGERLDMQSIESLINYADRALYQAKVQGRNRVSIDYLG